VTTIYRDADADPAAIAGETVAVVGYGNQGRSQALNLRDSGLTVRVGNRGDAAREQALADGFEVLPIAAACERADLVLLLIPDEIMPAVYAVRRGVVGAAGERLRGPRRRAVRPRPHAHGGLGAQRSGSIRPRRARRRRAGLRRTRLRKTGLRPFSLRG